MGIELRPQPVARSFTHDQVLLLKPLLSGPKSMRELHAATGRHMPGRHLRAALDELRRTQDIEVTRALAGPRGGRPRETWRLLPHRSPGVSASLSTAASAQTRARTTRLPQQQFASRASRIRRHRSRCPVPQTMANRILDWVSEGRFLRDFCRQPGTPAVRTIYDWLQKDSSFQRSFGHARDIGEMCIGDELLEIVDSPALSAAYLLGSRTRRDFQRRVIGPYLQRLQRWRPNPRRRYTVTVISGL